MKVSLRHRMPTSNSKITRFNKQQTPSHPHTPKHMKENRQNALLAPLMIQHLQCIFLKTGHIVLPQCNCILGKFNSYHICKYVCKTLKVFIYLSLWPYRNRKCEQEKRGERESYWHHFTKDMYYSSICHLSEHMLCTRLWVSQQ